MNQPILLIGIREISKNFKVGRNTVIKWYNEQAPIAFYGHRYSSELNSLQEWLCEKTKRADLQRTIFERGFIELKTSKPQAKNKV